MRKIYYVILTAVIGFTSVSCVEKSEKYKSLKAEKEALQIVAGNYEQTLDILNDMESGFAAIREREGKILLDMNAIEKGPKSKKIQMAADMQMIQELIEMNRQKIDSLENSLNQNKQSNRSLRASLDRMKKEVEEKTALIASLQADLEQKNIRIGELVASVDELNTTVGGLSEENATQQATIRQQDEDMNRVWYCIATDKELKAANIVTKKNIFRSKQVMKKDFDKNSFTAMDLRHTLSFDLDAKDAKLLSNHPEGSYAIKETENKKMTLTINDPVAFWSLTKYMVMSVDK
ncbi:MAG: hypothetical protein ACRCSQ_03445 [Bacteroidales bacterium]